MCLAWFDFQIFENCKLEGNVNTKLLSCGESWELKGDLRTVQIQFEFKR